MLYETLRPIARIALGWYYRSITVAGAERIPPAGPVFLAVNHPNALVDALVVACSVERRVRFTAKATIFANPLAARFFRAAGVVPLRRASDETPDAKAPGIGDRYPVLDTTADSGKVARAEDPEQNAAALDPVRSAASSDPNRNAASFGAVADALAEGAAIVIFPEGKSHDLPGLAPLRTGLARMTRMAQQERGVRGIRIVPVGLLFERKEEPRTRVLVQVGEPLVVDDFPDGGDAVAALTETVAARLSAVTLNFETPEDAARIQLVGETLAALLEPTREVSEDVVPLSTTLALVRRIERVHGALRGRDAATDARLDGFEARLRAFRDRLSAAGIDVHDLAIDAGAAPGARFALREGLVTIALLPFVLWGRATHWLPVTLARRLALRNVRARDEPAMRTIVSGLLLVLLSYALQTALVAWLAGPWWALLFLLTLVPSASSDFRYGDRLHRARARARAYFRFRRDPALQPSLLAEADWLRAEAGALESLVP